MRGRKKQQGSTRSAAAPVKERETGRERQLRRRGKEKHMGGEVNQAAQEKPGKEMEKEKEKEKEKEEMRDDGEQNDKEKEKEKVCPQFFKVFFPEQSTERLKIPPLFHKHLKDQPTGPVSLKGPSGNKWQATLTSESEVWCFEKGWKEFVTDHSLNTGHFLVFTYDGPSQFSVAVFSATGIVDPAALDAKPANDALVLKVQEEGDGVQGDVDAGGGTSKALILCTEEGKEVTGKRTRAMSDLPADASAPKKQSTLAKKSRKKKPRAGTSKDASSTVDNSTFSLLDESKASNKTQIREKDVPRSGKFLLKAMRAPVVISQRRPVTEEEKDLALRKANDFKSKYPFTVQIMMESYVYVGFFMNVACEFVRESLPQTSKKMTLWDPLGKAWEVNYVYYSERAVGAFSGGWGKFALGNNLEKFDVCVFELFKEDNIRVHIYRVVPEITPLLRASSRD